MRMITLLLAVMLLVGCTTSGGVGVSGGSEGIGAIFGLGTGISF